MESSLSLTNCLRKALIAVESVTPNSAANSLALSLSALSVFMFSIVFIHTIIYIRVWLSTQVFRAKTLGSVTKHYFNYIYQQGIHVSRLRTSHYDSKF